jgi:hypothetical protein
MPDHPPDHIERDPTPKPLSEQASAQHEAPRETEAASAIRRKRLAQLAIMGTVDEAVVVVLITTGDSSQTHRSGSTQATERKSAPSSPASHRAPTRWGSREFTLGALPSIIHRWVHSGPIKIEYHSHRDSNTQARNVQDPASSRARRRQAEQMWYFIETFYHEQGDKTLTTSPKATSRASPARSRD